MQTSTASFNADLEELVELCDETARPRAEQLLARWRAGSMRVALVGEAKRGKSTLGNALLGEEVLPAGVVPVTSVVSEVRTGAPRRVEIAFHDGTVRTADIPDLEEFVSERLNPHNQQQVAAVSVYLPDSLPHPQMVLVDTPGFGSVHRHNTETAREAYESMDAAVFVLTADSPISASETALLHEVASRSVRVFVVLNKVDQLEPEDLFEATDFVSDAVSHVLGHRPRLWPCSARRGLRGRLAGDQRCWLESGVADFLDALVNYLIQHRARDLGTSLATAASRLVAQQLDALAVTLSAIEAAETDQADRLAQFGLRLDAVDRRRDEALELIAAHLRRERRLLDEDAAQEVHRAGHRLHGVLDNYLTSADHVRPADLERESRLVIAQDTIPAVEAWRAGWHQHLEPSYRDLVARLQRELAEAGGDLDAGARHLLGIRLHSEVPILAHPNLPDLHYDFEPEAGWNQALVSRIRTHAPRGIARRRVERYVREEVDRTVDKHLGRARSGLQDVLEDTGRQLSSQVADAFAQLTEGLRSGQEAALKMLRRDQPLHRSERKRLTERQAALTRLAESLQRSAAQPGDESHGPGTPTAPRPLSHDHGGEAFTELHIAGPAGRPHGPGHEDPSEPGEHPWRST